jgi:hypothetical protein
MSDKGVKYFFHGIFLFYKENWIIHQTSSPYTLQ